MPPSGPGSIPGCRPPARQQDMAGAPGGRRSWIANRCGAPGMPAATASRCTCWPPSTSTRRSPGPGPGGRQDQRDHPVRAVAGAAGTGRVRYHRRRAATQREHAQFLVTQKKAHYILVVKKNQPGLYAQVRNLPWRHVPVAARQHGRGHGRQEHRTLKTAAVAAGLAFPHAAQAIRLTRRIRPLDGGKWRTVTVYAITSLHARQATRPSSPPGSAVTGASRCCITSATVSYGEDSPRSAPTADPRSWPPRQPRHRHLQNDWAH